MSQEKSKWKVKNEFFSSDGKKEHRSYHGKKKYHKNGESSEKQELKEAKAPYNFIPLNEKVIEVEKIPGKDKFTFDRYHEDRHTGCIKLEITTKTPLYIRDTLNEKELKEKVEIEKDTKKKYINPDFFSPGGEYRIPGSSLRGMIRTLVEIVSYGKLHFFEKEKASKFHFRSFADKSLDLRDIYKQKMVSGRVQIKSGYLFKYGNTFRIKPAQNNGRFYHVKEDIVINSRILNEKMCNKDEVGKFRENKKYKMGFKTIKFIEPEFEDEKYSQGFRGLEIKNIYQADKSISEKSEIKEGSLIHSGWIGGTKRNPKGKKIHWIVGPEDENSKELEFEEGVIDDYKNDINRDEQANLLKYLEKDQNKKIPCFFIEKNGKAISFGHTRLFRLAYEKTLGDNLPEALKDSKKVDLAEAIFGNEKDFAGRVFFEDAFLDKNQSNFLMEESIPQILAGPNPTSFQLYLEQNENKLKSERGNIRGLKNYNDADAQIRGYKLYWHKSGKTWEETCLEFKKSDFDIFLKERNLNREDFRDSISTKEGKEKIDLNKLRNNNNQLYVKVRDAVGIYETQHTRIKTVDERAIFIGNIRFENLSDIELGALLFALDLTEKCCHKIGMGKPLGLGSVKIKPQLFLSDRKKRYEDLFTEWDDIIESIEEDKTITTFKEKFEKYILINIGEYDNGISSLWDLERMKELKHMLDFSNKPKDEETFYMELKDFKERNVLPRPSQVKKKE